MSLSIPKSLTRQLCNPCLPLSNKDMAQMWQRLATSRSVWVATASLQTTHVMLTPDVAYLGKMEQLTDAGSSLGGQSGNPPEAPEALPTPHPHPRWTALPQESKDWAHQHHFHSRLTSSRDMEEAALFLPLNLSLISEFSKFKSAAPKTFLTGHEFNQIISFWGSL